MKRTQLLMVVVSLVAGNAFAASVPSGATFVDGLDVTVDCLARPLGKAERVLCQSVIDISKLKTVDCTGDLEDGYQAGLCKSAIEPMKSRSTLGCTGTIRGALTQSLCSQVIDTQQPSVADRVDCTGDLEDGYQRGLCQSVNALAQKAVRARLPLPMQR